VNVVTQRETTDTYRGIVNHVVKAAASRRSPGTDTGNGTDHAVTAPVSDHRDADARFVIDHVASWITNADLKAGLLATGLIFAIGVLADQRAAIARQLLFRSATDGVAVAAAAAAIFAFLRSALYVARTVSPRVESTPANRFSWPSLADADVDELLGASAETVRREAWEHARQLARITRVKFAAVAVAVHWFCVGGGFLAAWAFLGR
jgi:hypothetical protein